MAALPALVGPAAMSPALLLALVGFAVATSVTPGPNNTMLLASGVNHGFRRTLPHIAGIVGGCVVMVLLIGLGLGRLLEAFPLVYVGLRYAGAAYLLLLAWRLARSDTVRAGARARPMGFGAAMLFQWVNPKAWVMVVGAVTSYAPQAGFVRSVAAIALVLALVSLSAASLWAGFGLALRRLLDRPSRVRTFNVTMAGLLVLSLVPVLLD